MRAKAGAVPPGKESLPALTGLRFLAAIYVVVFHFRDALPENLRKITSVAEFLSKGYLGVSLFFLLSGFILAVVYEGRLNSWNERKRYFVARFARVYPVYLLGLLLMYLAAYARHPDRFSWSKGIQVLFLVQAWHPFNHKIAGYWNDVAWTLSVEVFFYICFPAFLMLFQRRGNKWLAILFSATLFVSIVCKSPEMQLYGLLHRGNVAHSLPFAILRLPEFAAGMLLGLLYNRRDLHHPNRWPLTSAGFFCAMFVLIMPYNSWNSLIVLPASALIYGLATQPTPLSYLLSTSAMQRLGQASYAIYLLQMGTFFLIDYAIRRFLPELDANVSRIVIVSLILFSLLVFRFWEEPLRHQIRIRLGGSLPAYK